MVGDRLEEDGRAVAAADAHAIGADLREAYERGRRDERGSRRRHPVFMALTFACALVGLVLLALAGVNGSFTDAGAVVDRNLQVAAHRAGPAMSQAASDAQSKVADAAR
jgi:hypothetical protein